MIFSLTSKKKKNLEIVPYWAIPIIIRTPPVEESLSHVDTPLEFPQIFM
jgi:hypothetical protein